MIGQFILYNLLPSLAIGLLAWGFITAALHLLPISDPMLRLGFLSLPAVKSTLVLFGWHAMLPWPGTLFEQIQMRAVPWQQLWPFLLGWAGFLLVTYLLLVRGVRRRLLESSWPVGDSHRLRSSLRRVDKKLAGRPIGSCYTPACTVSRTVPSPELRLTNQISSPLALTEGGQPLILWPTGLAENLSEAEIDAIMAHELGHFVLRRRFWCSTTLLRRLTVISPATILVGAQLNWEEELACDDLARDVVGAADLYAGALLKSARHARESVTPAGRWFQPLPQLLGRAPFLTRRVERLLSAPTPATPSSGQNITACLLSIATILLFFTSI